MRFLVRRVVTLVAVLFAVSVLTFLSLNLLGDPLKSVLGPAYADAPVREKTRVEMNLDDSIPVRYVKWMTDAATGDFGTSYATGRDVSSIISEKLGPSLLLMAYAQVLAVVIAVPIAILAAYRAGGFFDRVSTTASFGVIALPVFALGVILFYMLAINTTLFPSRYDDASLGARLNSLTPAALSLALPLAATYIRLLRTDLISTLQEDYILMAKAKGLPTRYILLRHALRPSTFSFITVAGIQVGALIGGGLVVERIFSIPGIGSEIVTAVVRDDFLLVQAIVLIIAAAYVLVNFLVELVYAYLDPRVRSLHG